MALELFIIFLTIIANGFFSLAELAILSANKTRLKILARTGTRGAAQAMQLAENSEDFLPAAQSCISLFGVFAGVFSGATFAERLGAWINQIPLLAPHGVEIALPFIVLMVSYFSMVLGELVPKQLAVNHAERWAVRVAPLMMPIMRWLMPGVRVLRVSTQTVLRLFPSSRDDTASVSEEEVKELVDEGTEGGVFEVAEQQMIKRVLRLADRPVRAIMTARGDVNWLNIHDDMATWVREIREMRHSVYPVCDGSLDQIVGVIRAKDLLDQAYDQQPMNLTAVMQDITIIPETASVLTVLEKLKRTTIHMGFVVDEYGVLEGIVTEFDILEAIVGELAEDDTPAATAEDAVMRADGSLLLDGAMAIDEVKEQLSLPDLPGEANYHTLGGIALGCLGRIPRTGDVFDHAGWRFEIVDMDGRRVDKLLVMRLSVDKKQD